MSLQVALYSDLHTEFYDDPDADWFFSQITPTTGIDVAVFAGDILLGRNSHRFIERAAKLFPHVVHVCGNHEFYSGEFDSVLRGFRKDAERLPNYHFLERDQVVIEGQRFIGCTLWYNGGINCVRNEMWMNDFRCIYHEQKGFRKFIYGYASESKAWLKRNVREGDVVVTHMLPHLSCIDNSYRDSDMNDFYYNDCDVILQENKPAVWCHGHSHNHYDEKIYETRVIRNPHGYPGERDCNWKKDFSFAV